MRKYKNNSEKKSSQDRDLHRLYLQRLLASRFYTRCEVVEKLVGRGSERADAEDLTEEFVELGLLDDAVYARLFAEGHDSWGAERIRYELRRRGIDSGLIDEALTECDEPEKARPLVASWAAQGVEWRKIAARLARRGFSRRTIDALGRGESETDW